MLEERNVLQEQLQTESEDRAEVEEMNNRLSKRCTELEELSQELQIRLDEMEEICSKAVEDKKKAEVIYKVEFLNFQFTFLGDSYRLGRAIRA